MPRTQKPVEGLPPLPCCGRKSLYPNALCCGRKWFWKHESWQRIFAASTIGRYKYRA